MVTHEELEKLEKKYFKIVYSIFSKPKNIKFVKDSLKVININLKYIKGKKDNQVEDSLEQVVRTILFDHMIKKKKWKAALFPVGSDVTFELHDCFLFCDAKTIKVGDPDEKNRRIQVQANESTYPDNRTPYKMSKGKKQSVEWAGPNIPTTILKKPVITFFCQFYFKKIRKKYKIQEAVLYCIPNGKLAKRYGDLIHTYKQFTTTIPPKIKGNRVGSNARFNTKKVKKPKFTKSWQREKLLPDYN